MFLNLYTVSCAMFEYQIHVRHYNQFSMAKHIYLNNLQEAMFGLFHGKRKGLLLEVVGVEDTEGHLHCLFHQP